MPLTPRSCNRYASLPVAWRSRDRAKLPSLTRVGVSYCCTCGCVQLFFCLPGAEAALTANDWALFRQIMGSSCSQQQLDVYVQQLSQPGGWRACGGGRRRCLPVAARWRLQKLNSPMLYVSLSRPHTQNTPRSAVQVRSRPHSTGTGPTHTPATLGPPFPCRLAPTPW